MFSFPQSSRIPHLCFSACSLLLTAGLVGVAHATPVGDPLPGPSGLGVIPTTQTVAPGHFDASLDYEYVDINGSSGHAQQEPFVNLTYGFRNGEIGASYLHQKTDVLGFSSDTDYFTLHGKYRLYNSADGKTAVAVGIHYYDFRSDGGSDLGNVLSLYGTASYEFRKSDDNPLGRLHVGVLGQRAHVPGDSTTYARPFLGAEVFATPELSVGVDYLFRHGDVAKAYTASLRYQPQNKPLSAQIGVGTLRSDTKYFVGLTYSLGK